MKFIIEPMSEPVDFGVSDVWSLSVLAPQIYRKMIEELHAYYYGRKEGSSVRMLDDKDNLLEISKNILIIHDSYTFDMSSRPIITALMKDLQKKSTIDDGLLAHIEKGILELIGELDLQSVHKLSYKPEVDLQDILKMMEIRLAASEQYGLIEKMYSIIEIARDILAKQLIVFVNQRCLISPEEFVGLKDFAKHQQQSILFIDPLSSLMAKGEQRAIIDEDLYFYKR